MSNPHATKSRKFSLHPLFWLAVCFASGIIISGFAAFHPAIFPGFCLLNGFLAIVFVKRRFVGAFILAAFVFLGAFVCQIENQTLSPNRLKRIYDEKQIESGELIEIEGVLQSEPEPSVNGFFFVLSAKKITYKNAERDISGKIKIFAAVENKQNAEGYEQLDLRYGSRIRVVCNPRREEGYLNPGMISRLKFLDEQGIDASANVKSPFLIKKIADNEYYSPLSWIYRQRRSLIIEFNKRFSVSTAGILIASLLGNKHFLDKTTSNVFREGGTFHILVISGLHITFIGGLLLLLIRFFTNKRLWQFLLACAFLWSYALAVGAEIPVVRACVMFTILLFSQVVFRTGTLLNSLGACALILLIWRPNDLYSSSFQLTFASVAAIVVAAFPLIENLRSIGKWTPSAETPFPPRVPRRLKRFCEALYWRPEQWEIQTGQQIWSAKLFKSPYLKWLEAKNLQTVASYVFEAVVVSLIVQLWLLPVLIIYFNRVSAASVLLNLWVGFFIALESFAAVFAVAIAQISDVAAFPFIKLTEILNWFLISIPSIFIENEWASFRVPVYSGTMKTVYFAYFAFALILTIALNLWNPFALYSKFNNRKLNLLVAVSAGLMTVFLVIIVFHPYSAPEPDGKLHIDFLDVGQGDSALITFPNGETLLIDGGGQIDYGAINVEKEGGEAEIFEPDVQSVGESVVSRFLWQKGYSNVDYILATHADADHIKGLIDVAKNFRIRCAFFGRTPLKNVNYNELHNVLLRRGTEILSLKRGDVLYFGDAKAEVLHPKPNVSPQADSDNNHSLVLRLSFGAKKFLFNGDIEKETEFELAENPLYLKADLVKVAHHGSRTSSSKSFIEATNAEYAVIPVGRRSQFGHPHKEVLERWKASGAKIYTTGERGTISVSTDGKNLEIQTFIR